MAHRWYYIGLALRLKPSDLEKIRSNQPDDQFRNMILEWLKMNYNTEKHGLPTWRRIVEAVNASGENTFLANQLARKYGSKLLAKITCLWLNIYHAASSLVIQYFVSITSVVVTHEKQPTSPTPDSDNIPNITSPIGFVQMHAIQKFHIIILTIISCLQRRYLLLCNCEDQQEPTSN